MPYKSQAQRRLFHWLESQGKLAPQTVHEYDVASKGKKLPEHVPMHKKKAFGGEVKAKEGVHCPACDYPLDSVPVALDAGEGCPRCGYGDAKDVPHKAHGGTVHHGMPKSHSGKGGEVMDSTAYRARGGVTLPHGGGGGLERSSMAVGHGGAVPCARCGHTEKYAHGGAVMHCARCGAPVGKHAMGGEVGGPLHGDMKEMYPRGKDQGAHLDDGVVRGHFAKAIKHLRRR